MRTQHLLDEEETTFTPLSEGKEVKPSVQQFMEYLQF